MLNKNNKQQKFSDSLQLIQKLRSDQSFIPSQEITQDIAFFCKNGLTATGRRVLNYLIFVSRKYKMTYMRQDTIARACNDVRRETINRLLKQLVALNFIRVINRGVHKSCIYVLSSFFLRYDIRKKLRPILSKSAILLYPTYLLVSMHYNAIRAEKITNVTQEEVYSYITSYFTTRNRTVCTLDSHSTKKEERALEQFRQDGTVVADYVTKLRLPLTLTGAGQLKLSVFPEGAIKAIQLEASHGRKINYSSGFGILYKIASEWCKNNDLRPDWEWYDRMKIRYEIIPDVPLVETPTTQKKGTTQATSYGKTPSLDVKRLIEQWYRDRKENRITPSYVNRRLPLLFRDYPAQEESVRMWLASPEAAGIQEWLGGMDSTSSEEYRHASSEEKMIIAQKNVIAFRQMDSNHPSIHNLATLFGTDLARSVLDAISRRWEEELARLVDLAEFSTAVKNEDQSGEKMKGRVV